MVALGGFVAMGQRVKNTIDVCDLPYNRHTLWEKEYDMVRLARASECEVNGVDICSAAFARRWRCFVADVHRAFAILAQERAISFVPPPSPTVTTFCWKYSSSSSFYV